MEIRFHRLAIRELIDAAAWYRARSAKAADRFLDEVDNTVELIQKFPLANATVLEAYRYALLKNFPYVVVYRVLSESLVFVWAVAHTSRKTGYWKRRKVT